MLHADAMMISRTLAMCTLAAASLSLAPATPASACPIGDPLPPTRTVCDDVDVRSMIGSPDARFAVAFLVVRGTDGVQPVRVGSRFRGRAVVSIDADRVLLDGPSGACFVEGEVRKIGDAEWSLSHNFVDRVLEQQAELMHGGRIVPESREGHPIGVRLFGIREGNLLRRLGFENGDMLRTINGFDMADPQKALEAYARLRCADTLVVGIVRAGVPRELTYVIR